MKSYKFINKLFNNIYGVTFIELVIALFIVGTLSIGFVSLSAFLNLKTYNSQFETMNQTTKKIKRIIQNNCPFKGQIFNQDQIPIPQISRGGITLYISTQDPSFSSKNHSLGGGVFIQSMTLEKPDNNYSLFKIKYLYGEDAQGTDLIYEEKFFAYIILDSDNTISHCSPFFCPEKYLIPNKALFLDSPTCQAATNDNILSWRNSKHNGSTDTTENLLTQSINNGDTMIPFVYFHTPQAFSRKTYRKTKTITSGTKQCTCLAIFICFQGFWSEAIKCFEAETN